MMRYDLAKECLQSYWNTWMELKVKLSIAFAKKDHDTVKLMVEAVELYSAMVTSFHQVANSDGIAVALNIRPLNEKERLQFIQEKIAGQFAFIQLDALFSEARKKAVSQLAMKSK